jgi:dolichol-phosphate mannosyltransferase
MHLEQRPNSSSMSPKKLLLFVPTYNESNNVKSILDQILALNIDADILFVDDNSPDGTGKLLDELAKKHARLIVQHRPKKLGIGSAHRDGIQWAYANSYDKIITLDCDATHPPEYIPDFINASANYDIVVGSRHIQDSSLADWSLKRKFLTKLGHFLTFYCLSIPYDATGAFRIYNLKAIPESFLQKVRSQGYSFFFESLFVLHRNRFRIGEVAIHLPSRINDQSKMRYKDIYDSLYLLVTLLIEKIFNPSKFVIEKSHET